MGPLPAPGAAQRAAVRPLRASAFSPVFTQDFTEPVGPETFLFQTPCRARGQGRGRGETNVKRLRMRYGRGRRCPPHSPSGVGGNGGEMSGGVAGAGRSRPPVQAVVGSEANGKTRSRRACSPLPPVPAVLSDVSATRFPPWADRACPPAWLICRVKRRLSTEVGGKPGPGKG